MVSFFQGYHKHQKANLVPCYVSLFSNSRTRRSPGNFGQVRLPQSVAPRLVQSCLSNGLAPQGEALFFDATSRPTGCSWGSPTCGYFSNPHPRGKLQLCPTTEKTPPRGNLFLGRRKGPERFLAALTITDSQGKKGEIPSLPRDERPRRIVQFTFGGKKMFQNRGAGVRNSTGTSEPS